LVGWLVGFAVLGLELRTYTLGSMATLQALFFFVMSFSEIGACELFAQDGFEP
jgi:hypothetical protein